MKKKLFSVLLALVLALSLCLVTAVPVGAQDNKPITPPEVKEVTFIHYARPDSPGKPPAPPGQAKKDEEPPPVDNTYYELLGLYLPSTFSYKVNLSGAPEGALVEIRQAFETWDGVVTTELFNDAVETTTISRLSLDGQNVVFWNRIAPPKIIAMVRIWYLDDEGTPDPIIEFDIVLNAFLKWGIDPDPDDEDTINAFDVQNIVTHEVGHPVGLDDLYEEEYRELTMYGYSSKGETQKISLEQGDKDGALYIYEY